MALVWPGYEGGETWDRGWQWWCVETVLTSQAEPEEMEALGLAEGQEESEVDTDEVAKPGTWKSTHRMQWRQWGCWQPCGRGYQQKRGSVEEMVRGRAVKLQPESKVLMLSHLQMLLTAQKRQEN